MYSYTFSGLICEGDTTLSIGANNLLDQDLKGIVLPLFGALAPDERLARLCAALEKPAPAPEDADLGRLAAGDFAWSSSWTRACARSVLAGRREDGIPLKTALSGRTRHTSAATLQKANQGKSQAQGERFGVDALSQAGGGR